MAAISVASGNHLCRARCTLGESWTILNALRLGKIVGTKRYRILEIPLAPDKAAALSQHGC